MDPGSAQIWYALPKYFLMSKNVCLRIEPTEGNGCDVLKKKSGGCCMKITSFAVSIKRLLRTSQQLFSFRKEKRVCLIELANVAISCLRDRAGNKGM